MLQLYPNVMKDVSAVEHCGVIFLAEENAAHCAICKLYEGHIQPATSYQKQAVKLVNLVLAQVFPSYCATRGLVRPKGNVRAPAAASDDRLPAHYRNCSANRPANRPLRFGMSRM